MNKRDITKYAALVSMAYLLTACGSGSSNDNHNAETTVKPLTVDQIIIDSVYSGERIPEGFNSIEVLDNEAFFKTRHLKSAEGYELATDDINIAFAWDEAVNSNELINVQETELYYQFTRTRPKETSNDFDFIDRARVFNSNIIDRVGTEQNCLDCYQGKVNPGWITPTNVKLIVEYLWSFTFDNNYGTYIFQTNVIDNGSEIIYTMDYAQLTAAACDTINIYKNNYVVDRITGEIWKTHSYIRNVEVPCEYRT